MSNEKILKHIAENHKIYVPRPWWEVCGILLVIMLSMAIVASPFVWLSSKVTSEAVYNYSESFIEADQAGCVVYTIRPKDYSKSVDYVQPSVSYLWGLINIKAGPRELRYYLNITLGDGKQFKAEVTQEQQNEVSAWNGLEIDYLVGRNSGRYYIKAVRSKEVYGNGLLERLANDISPK